MLRCDGAHPGTANRSNETDIALLPRVSLLLAGGDGARLQELTRAVAGTPIPKQYCRLLHGSSLLEATLARAQFFSPRDQISVVIQPLNRETGPGLIFSLLNLEQRYSDAIVAAFPTDHYIENDTLFMKHVLRAADTVSDFPEKIAILGVAPDRPETGYGYILPACALDQTEGIYHVDTFTEKPDRREALAIIDSGGLWNTFVMVFKLSRMLELLREFAPDRFAAMSLLRQSLNKAPEIYPTLGPWNLSTSFLAQIPEHLIVVKTEDVGWSDWGTRESIERTYRTLNIAPFWNLPSTSAIHAGG
jgi:mannose-1-phosphate guanylyltransferase